MEPDKKRNLIFILTICSTSVYLIWRVFGTIPWTDGVFQAAAGILLAAAEMVTALGMFELMISRMRAKKTLRRLPDVPEEKYPEVDVLIATHNEPAELLYKTVNACTFLEYPDKRKVHIYLCDDGCRQEAEELAQRLGVGYLGLSDNRHAKSGNYNNALAHTSSPLIATFDADMIPRREFLVRTVPYFLDPGVKMGLVQTPQSFYNQDLFQFNLFSEKDIPNEQDFFSREVNVMRNASNSAAYTGSNTVILRSALEEIGGLFEDGISPEQIVKDSAEFFRTLLLYKEGIRRTDVLGSAIKDIPEDIVNALTREQLEAALKSFLTLYRELRYSLSPRFEIELLYSRLSSLPLLATPDVLMKKLEDLKNGVAEGSVVISHKAKAAPVQIQAARTEATAPPQPAYEAEPAEEEEEASEEEEEPGQRGPLSLDDIPAIAESLLKMGKRAESRYVSDIEAIEENDDGTFSLLLSKPLAFNSLKNAEKDLQKAIASATGEGYMIRLRLKEQRDHADEGFSPEMRKLKAFFGGQLVRKEGAVTEEDREDEYITFRNDEEDQLS